MTWLKRLIFGRNSRARRTEQHVSGNWLCVNPQSMKEILSFHTAFQGIMATLPWHVLTYTACDKLALLSERLFPIPSLISTHRRQFLNWLADLFLYSDNALGYPG